MPRKVTNTLKHDLLREQLLERIAAMPPGAKLQGIRGIMSVYGVSQLTVDRALRDLKEQGRIESHIGRGTFVSAHQTREKDRKLRRVDLIRFADRAAMHLGRPGFHAELNDQLGQALGSREASLRTTVLDPDAGKAEVAAHVERLSVEAAIVMTPFGAALGEILQRRRIPYVQMLSNAPTDLPNSILLDNRMMSRCWVDHLVGLGHRRIAFLHGVGSHRYSRDAHERRHFFYEEMAHRSLVPDPDLFSYAGYSPEEGYASTRKLLAGGKAFSAIIINDYQASGVYKAIKEAGLRIGRDLSVIGTDDLGRSAHLDPPLTTVRIPRRQLAEQAVQKLQEMACGQTEGFRLARTTVRLIVRESTGRVGSEDLEASLPAAVQGSMADRGKEEAIGA